ncbi:MAG: hypothetical protein AB7F86_18950 [Bdellovibrionales bacterium]
MSLALILTLFFSGFAAAKDSSLVNESYGSHYGYVFDVADEKTRRDVEMVMLPQPPRRDKSLKEVIFNQKLSKEFVDQYEARFGRSQPEQVFNTVARSDDFNFYGGQTVTVRQYQLYQEQYAEYMGRRLVEYHFDKWAKEDPEFRPIYEAKDKISNVNFQVRKGYKFKWRYNFAGPNMEARLENPYDVNLNARIEMTGIISDPTEYVYTIGYPVSPRLSVSLIHRQIDEVYQLVFSRSLNSSTSVSVSGSTDQSDKGASVRQDLILVGLGWRD